MFLKTFDFLSPRISIYYKGELTHSSIISGILSIISILILICIGSYFSLDIIKRKNPNVLYFNSFIEDSGIFKLNKTSLFHFINIAQIIKKDNYIEKFDFRTFNIIGSHIFTDNFLLDRINVFDHWIYGYCNKDSNFEGLDDLIDSDFFEKSACVQKYFNHIDKKYYSIDDPQFKWPEISHGTFNELNQIYGIYVLKCSNTIINQILGNGSYCKNDSEIEDFFSLKTSKIIHLHFLDHYINILNYENPDRKYIYKIESPFYKNQYSSINLNINPVFVRTHNGLILDNIEDITTYKYERNDLYIYEREDKMVYIGLFFFLKNTRIIYERTYKRIQDVISSIGGIFQAINIIAIYLNYLNNNFIILSDTGQLLHSLNKRNTKINEKRC